MKYICLGFFDERKWEAISESEQNAFFTIASATTRGCGRTATGLVGKRFKALETPSPCDGRAARCPSPTARMLKRKSSLGGFGVFEARDLDHAVQLMSKHPAVKTGILEIRPAEDLTEMIRESERRRSTTRRQ
jgi:hypothetical protein